MASFIAKFDAYPRTIEDFRIKTYGGAIMTLICGISIIALLISEFRYYKGVDTNVELIVDTTRAEKMNIFFNVTFHNIPCEFLTLDVMDAAGDEQPDVEHDVYKVKLDLEGRPLKNAPKKEELGDQSDKVVSILTEDKTQDNTYCGSCYGAVSPHQNGCCQTCDDVRSAYRSMGWSLGNLEEVEQCKKEGWTERLKNLNEGCNLYGELRVNKVAGNFHIAPGKSFQQNHAHIHDINPFLLNIGKLSTSHTIHQISFGKASHISFNPLDGVKKQHEGATMTQYFIKVIPTTLHYLNGTTVHTNQFSATQHEKVISGPQVSGLPGTIFSFEISPMLIIYTEKQRSIFHFLTGVCSIVGGIFTVAGIIDTFLYSAERTLRKKIELGKSH